MTWDELRQCANLVYEIEELDERIARLRGWKDGGMLGAVAAGRADSGRAGGSPDRIGKTLVALEAMEREAAEKVARYTALMARIDRAVDGIADRRIRRIIRLRYVDGRPWDDVCGRMRYSYSQCKRLHDIGVKIMVG